MRRVVATAGAIVITATACGGETATTSAPPAPTSQADTPQVSTIVPTSAPTTADAPIAATPQLADYSGKQLAVVAFHPL